MQQTTALSAPITVMCNICEAHVTPVKPDTMVGVHNITEKGNQVPITVIPPHIAIHLPHPHYFAEFSG